MKSQIDKIIQHFQDTSSKKDRQKIGVFQRELCSDRKMIDSVPIECRSKMYSLLRSYYIDKVKNKLIFDNPKIKSFLLNRVKRVLNSRETTSKQDKIYEALYNPMTEESAYRTLSLHRTREGAEKAIEDHKKIVREEEDSIWDNEEDRIRFPWDGFKDWQIRETELLD